jgi:hypothetical protein
MLAIRPQRVREQELGMVGEMPIERSAQLILLLLYLCFTCALPG